MNPKAFNNDWNEYDDILDPNTKITICPLVPFGEHVYLYRCKGCTYFKGIDGDVFSTPPEFCGHKKIKKRYKMWCDIQKEQNNNDKLDGDTMELIKK